MSPTQRTLKWYRDTGMCPFVVEHWNPFSRRRVDLFGFIDIVVLGEDQTIGVQCTSMPHVSSRVKKIANHENVGKVRKAGWKILVMGWAKGKKEPRIVDCS